MSDYVPGLAGVPATKSNISYIDGRKGILEYRGISIEELAEKSTFTETAYLLLMNRLPTREELEKFNYDLTHHRRIKYNIRDMLKCVPESAHPMDVLQCTVAALGMFYPLTRIDDEEYAYMATVRLIAKMPTIIAAFHQMRQGNDPVIPRDDLSHAGNFLYMMTEREPDPLQEKILDVCLILHAEHTMNASTFSGLVTASALADPYTVISSAIGTLSGPLHGGANEKVLRMLDEIGSVENVRSYIEEKLARKEVIMGLGHRVYKTKDPRAIYLQKLYKELAEKFGHDYHYEIALEVEKLAKGKLAEKGIYPNVDFYSGIVYRKLGIPTDIFTPIFAMARVAGWLAHWKEQLSDNRIFRPDQVYTGEHNIPYVPIDQR